MPESCYHTKPCQFHGRTFFVLAIKAEMPVNTWLSGAQEWISKSPGFFDGRPCCSGQGAEIVATGSIDVYGALRGSVLAKAEGNEKASICCKPLEAELLSICAH